MTPIVFSNLFIAAAAALFAHQTYYLLGVEPRWSGLHLLVFCATLVVYNLDRLSGSAREDEVEATERHKWIDRRRLPLWGAVGAGAVGIVGSMFLLPVDVILALIPLGVLSLAYSLPVLWGKSGPYRLKDIAGLKIFLIMFVWAGATGFLPAVEVFDDPFRPAVAAVVAERAVFIFAITLPFDIRDMARDRASEIQTIPLAIGVERTRRLSIACIGLFAAGCALHYGVGLASHGPPLLASAAITAWLLRRAAPDLGELYYVGKLDGMIALQWLLVAGWAEFV
jgi:4-hydroxybenzoate polyprenyltransferase